MNYFISKIRSYHHRTAVLQGDKRHSYGDLLKYSHSLASGIIDINADSLPIAFVVSPGFNYLVTLWGIWRSGAMAVPLSPHHPLDSLRHVLSDAGCKLLIVEDQLKENFSAIAGELGIAVMSAGSENSSHAFQDEYHEEALLLYTSGSTSLPKGVVLTHSNLQAQMHCLSKAWEWDAKDHILSVLPLHHVHGIVNVVCCALWNGAICEFLPGGYQVDQVLDRFQKGNINLFMAVPTIYYQLIKAWKSRAREEQKKISQVLQQFRLMISGSAALPVETLKQWKEISGHVLLERYGMTEIGMALSNPYRGDRHPGHVGWPLPGVQLKLMEQGCQVSTGEAGEIWVKGPTVFKAYWNLPKTTEDQFENGWFKTGDLAKRTPQGYRILGRKSVDIIKSGGYKISALEIEDVLLTHPQVQQCGVVGLPDQEWGERIVAALVTGKPVPNLEDLDRLVTARLPAYKKPREYFFLAELPRNALGKLVKPHLIQLLTNPMGAKTRSRK